MNNIANAGLKNLVEPEFFNHFNKSYDDTVASLTGVVDLQRGKTGEIYVDVIPPQGRATRYDDVNNTLPTQVIDENGNKIDIQFRRQRIDTHVYGVLQQIAAEDIPQLKFDGKRQLMRVMLKSLYNAIDYEIILASGRLAREEATLTTSMTDNIKMYDTGTISDQDRGTASTVTNRFDTRYYGDDGNATDGDRGTSGVGLTRGGKDPRAYSNTAPTTRFLAGHGAATLKVGEISIADLSEARGRIITRAKLKPTAELVLVLNPITAVDLLEDSIIREGFSETSSQLLTTGQLTRIFGCRVVQTPIMPPGGAMMMTPRAITLAIDSVDVRSERILRQANALRVGAWVNMGANLVYPEEVFFIHSRNTEFALQKPTSLADRFHDFFRV